MTPEEARNWNKESIKQNVPLDAVNDALDTIAEMRYQYAVAIGKEDFPLYVAMDVMGDAVGVPPLLADWWNTKEEAQSVVEEVRKKNSKSTARVVRILMSEPEEF